MHPLTPAIFIQSITMTHTDGIDRAKIKQDEKEERKKCGTEQSNDTNQLHHDEL
jgi:hypothetical protein